MEYQAVLWSVASCLQCPREEEEEEEEEEEREDGSEEVQSKSFEVKAMPLSGQKLVQAVTSAGEGD